MKPSLLEYLVCPACQGTLVLSVQDANGEEIIEGDLRCGSCAALYPVRSGVPQFIERHSTPEAAKTAASFGWQWRRFPELGAHHERQFLDWIAPATRETFSGAVVLEGGCGKGRHTRLAASYGAKAVIGIDFSEAVHVAHSATRDQPNAHVVQADLLRLPLRRGACDYAFSVGVLHHLSEPAAGFLSLAGAVRRGGAISVWVYGAEGNGWIARVVSPLRIAVTSRLPPRLLYTLAMLLTLPIYLALVTLYRPARRPSFAWMRRFLFYYPYLSYISSFPFREVHAIVHDHLGAPVAHYLKRETIEDWYRIAGARDVVIEWHNRNSWRAYGVIDPTAEITGVAR